MNNIYYLWNRITEIDPSVKRKPELPSDSFCSGFIINWAMKNSTSFKKGHQLNIVHGHSRVGKHNRIHNLWVSMRSRVNNRHAKSWNDYGGRGIKICEEWNTYLNFYEWAINNGYSYNLILDRIDNDGNYEPGNCRFVNALVSIYNRRKSLNYGIYYDRKGRKFYVQLRYNYKKYCTKRVDTLEEAQILRDELDCKLNNIRNE